MPNEAAPAPPAKGQDFASAQPPAVAPYSAFSRTQKWAIVALVSGAAFFGPMSVNVYFSAITQVAETVGESVEKINLSITVYLIFQAITPSIWGSLADVLGRRPIFLVTLAIYVGSAIGLIFTYHYWLLMLLRCLQAAGGAAGIAISQGVVSDFASPSERAGFIGIANLGPLSAPAIGPLIGAVITQSVGWHAIFIVLAAACGALWVALSLLLPETLRARVGDGSYHSKQVFVRPPIRLLLPGKSAESAPPEGQNKTFKDIRWLDPLRILLEKDIACALLTNATLYAIWYAVLTSFASDFKAAYELSTLRLGIYYIPNGVGCLIATLSGRWVLDRDFRIVAEHLAKNARTEEERSIPTRRQDIRDLTYFPVERARMRSLPAAWAVFSASTLIYAWTTQYTVNVAVPLIANFFNGLSINLILNSCSTLAVDCYPKASSSAIAANNLARCLFGAGASAAITPLIKRIRIGPAFTLFFGIQVLASGLGVMEWKHGMTWRQARAVKLADKA